MAKRLRCYVGLHRWVETVREKERFHLCRHCGKVRQGIRKPHTYRLACNARAFRQAPLAPTLGERLPAQLVQQP